MSAKVVAGKQIYRPGGRLACDEALFQQDMTGKVFLITSTSAGIGLFCAKKIIAMGATLVVASRSGGEKMIDDIAKASKTGLKPVSLHLDLSSLKSVRECAAAFLSKFDRLDCLINNAGVMMPPLSKTEDGFERQMGTNHFGHFLLTMLLKDALEKAAPSRVVILSSCAACKCTMMCKERDPSIDYDDLAWEKRKYEADQAYYGSSKLANALHAMEIPKRFSGVKAVSLHPGWVESKLMRYQLPPLCLGSLLICCFKRVMGAMMGVDDGSQTSLYCALADIDTLENGAFYTQVGIYVDPVAAKGGWPVPCPNPNAIAEEAAKLWDHSVMAVGL
jgi:NAD(P)-dependent dehydrogenase (short-subunit alcohol dehydrogenase family)